MNNASVVNTLMSVPFVKYNDLYEPFANKDARLLAEVWLCRFILCRH